MEKKENDLKKKEKDEEDVIEEQSIKTTRALIQTFLQTVKAFRLYEANHPILLKFLDRLKKDFDHFFEEEDCFPLLVGENRLFYRGAVVYESQEVKESLAFFFFQDGIREIKFLRGLEFREIVDFLQIVRKSESINRLEDDLVTLFWEKDFSHITIQAVDEFLDGESRFVPATEDDFLHRLEFRGSGQAGREEASSRREEERASLRVTEGLRQALNPSPGQSLVNACELNAGEIAEINRELEQERQPEYIYALIDNLIEILLHLGEDLEAYENMISYFERTVGGFLAQKELKKAVVILKRLNDTMESMVLKDKQIFAIRRILETFSNPHSIEFLGEILKGEEEVDVEVIHQYFRLLTKKAVEPLCRLLDRLESGQWRKFVCDILVDLSQEAIQPLIPFLSNPNPFLVCHILYVLRKIGNPSCVKHVGNLINHKDPKVREETLQLLKTFGGKGKDLIQKFLKDPDPEMRAKAALLYVKAAGQGASRGLTGIILSEDFFKRDYEEKVSFFRALGETGSEEAVPMLKKIVQKRKWLNKTKWDEMRLCAKQTLKTLGAEKESDSPEAKKRLSHIAKSIHG